MIETDKEGVLRCLVHIIDSINYEARSHLPCSLLELIAIEIKPKYGKPFLLLSWYRPPDYKLDDFEQIETVYQVLEAEGKEIIILLDTNCNDDSEEDNKKMIKLLRSFYKTYQIKQLITSTTRKTENTQSVIDHFATNRPDVITKTGTPEIGFSDHRGDHDIIYGMRNISGPKQKTTNNVITRDLKL